MSLRQEIREISVDLNAPDLLRYLIKDRFPGETVVTASLMAPSIAVLKMVADINPETPVVFCQRPPVFEESAEYRASIVQQLRLQNVTMNDGHETTVLQGDRDHTERMWVAYRDMPGRSSHLLHLNECLKPYTCRISAVYHTPPSRYVQNRVDVDGRMIKVDPLVRWTRKDVQNFMREHGLPYHKMAKRDFTYDETKETGSYPMYHF